MVSTQEWTAPIFPPRPAVMSEVNGALVEIEPARPGTTHAAIVLFDHPVRHRKAGQPDAHARRVVQRGPDRIAEVYLNRHYAVLAITGAYAGTNGRVRLVTSGGQVLAERVLTAAGPFTLVTTPMACATGFTVTLDHLDADYVAGHVTVMFRQEETEVTDGD